MADDLSDAFQPERRQRAYAPSVDSDIRRLDDEEFEGDNPNKIVTHAPKERFRLGYFDVICLIVNRMIGSGIFLTPQRVMQGTGSTGVTLIFWFIGVVYCLAGTHVYVEYGMNIPRYFIDGVEQSVPRSGGDLNYLQYIYRKPRYRKNTVLFVTCLFGVAFICLGNMAGNSINFASRVLDAADVKDPSAGAVRGVAIAVATFACFIHAFSRRGGILLNNLLAMIKIAMLLLIVITTIVFAAGGLPNKKNVIVENTSASSAFKNASQEANGYAHAFLAIIFAFSGFEQPNYVLGEISQPRRKFPISMAVGVTIVSTLYMIVNICYMVVVPGQDQQDQNVALSFFELTFGQLASSKTGFRIFNAFIAISSFGNIVVMTYTAARVKQEIAKEGIIPFAKFFAQNKDFSLGRLLKYFQNKGWFRSILKYRWLSPEEHSEETPVGALILHFLSCLVLLFATYNMSTNDAYNLLTTLSAYVVNAFFGTFLGLGILILRFRGPPRTAGVDSTDGHKPTWRQMTGRRFSPVLSVVAATIYLMGNLYPVITTWVPPAGLYSRIIGAKTATLQWYVPPVISWCILGLGAAWFLGFFLVALHQKRKHHRVFVVEKEPEFEAAEGYGKVSADGNSDEERDRTQGGLVLVHETVYLSWVGKETLRSRQPGGSSGRGHRGKEASFAPLSGTDFDAYFSNGGPNRNVPNNMAGF